MPSMRTLVWLPLSRYHWAAALDARREENWEGLASSIRRMHRCHWESDESWFLLGSALAKLERFQEGCSAFEQIGAPLSDAPCEQQRRLNHAVCLIRLGRAAEALDLLPGDRIESDFGGYARDAAELRATALEHVEYGRGHE
ncbi:MAG: hypothetical protein QNK05_12850 [Myxococcota bacterium]|nr:hypothetical protein [Myxococcota bacterium]